MNKIEKMVCSHADVLRMLHVSRQNGLYTYALLSPQYNEYALEYFFELNADSTYVNLFVNSSLHHIANEGPYLFEISRHHIPRMLPLLETSEIWGFVASSTINLRDYQKYWQTLLAVQTESGSITHLRFYDGDVCTRLLNIFTDSERAEFLSSTRIIAACGRFAGESEARWRMWANAQSGKIQINQKRHHDTPLWRFKKAYWMAFQDKMEGITEYSVTEYLFEEFPKETGRKNAEVGIEAFVKTCRTQALAYQLDDVEALKLFTACKLLGTNTFVPESLLPCPASQQEKIDRLTERLLSYRHAEEKGVTNGR